LKTQPPVPQGASTLAFVFDVTGSMYDDLVQVIEGASKILETSLSRPKRPLHNFALVPFHDPEIGPVTITTDPKKFQNELRELYVQGGGDCPEMSIGAIKIALEISLPGSYIYVFTDARSKDYKLTHEVLQLIQQKQSQVVFVLTGDCDDRSHIGYKVYEEIASTSSGQVFHLDKKQVNEVLKWVEEAVQSSKVHLLSTDHYNPSSNTWQIPFDPSLKEVTVALSGPAPGIEIRNPQGKLIGTKDGLTELLHIPNSAKVFNLKDPAPGMWSIKTISEGRHSVRITGLSTIDFRAGFSRKHTLDFKMTSSRPVQGPLLSELRWVVYLLSITGGVMKTLPIRYYPERLPYSIWNITEFVPPNEAFFLRVTGYDRDGYLFQRVSSVSFSSIVPGAPKVIMPSTTPGYYLQKGGLSCYVDSLIPYTVRFAREGERLGVDHESSNASWEITEVSLKDEGFYDCVAISSAGTGRARTFLDVSEPPPAVTVLSNATASPGSVALLTCVVASTVRYNLTWQRGGVDIRPDARLRLTTNLSLEILRVTPDDGGWYGCVAANEGGVSSSRIYLNVQAPPLVSVNPQNQTFSAGEEVWIRCSAKGYPTPTIVWTHNDMHRMTPEGALVIRNTVRKDAGAYSCLASNVAGTNTQTALLSYIESPQVTVPQSRMLTGLGQTVIMECTVTGIPQPEVLWYKGDQQVKASMFVSMDPQRGTLSIRQTEDADSGDYICVAVNLAGTAQGKITLDVGSAPQFTRQPSDVAADIGSNVTLTCHAQGHPEPRITWRREDNTAFSSRRHGHSTVTQKRNGDLQITNLWVEDGTTYLCEAQNHFGKIQTKARVTITGLEVSVIEEQQVTLPCVLLAGNPLPQRHWIHENTLITSGPYVSIRRDGSLHIERVSVQDGGEYTCVAENVAGSSNRTTTVHIYVMPTIQHGPQVFSTIEGTPISLPCHARGVPKPDITWAKMLDLNGGLFSLEEDGSLHIASPSGEESGEFVCTATNPAGYSSRKVQLTVYVRPRLGGGGVGDQTGSGELVEMSVKLGEDVTLPCEVQSVPPPTITWAKDKQLISPYSPRHTQLPSGSMKITEVRVTESGMYLCVATNIAGNFSQSVRLSVLGKTCRSIAYLASHQQTYLPCVAQGVPEPSVSWQKDGTTIVPDGTRYRFSPDGTLTIQKVTLTNEGVYTCTASNIAGQDKANIQLIVQGEGCCLGSVANQRIAFPCPAKGMPQPVIKWFRNGQELTGNEPGMSILEDGTLLILASVSPLDNGEYTCTAVNDAGSTEKKYQLKVNVPPDVRDKGLPANVSVVMNQPTSLLCDVTGTPPPVITWYKDGVLLKAATVDAGHYSCKAINIAGNTDKDFYLDVLVPPTIIGSGGSRDLSAILNQEISLVCKVKGVPFPTIQWYKDRKPVFLADPNIEVSDQGQVLKIKSARLGDQARYQCSVSNSAGKQSRDFNLSIYVPPSISSEGGMVTVVVNDPVRLECEVDGVPRPAITWLKDGQLVTGEPRLQVMSHGRFLHINDVQVADTGRYSCLASNSAGDRSIHFNLNVLVPPVISKDVAGEGFFPREIKIKVNNTLTLECEAQAIPTPTLQWYKDGQVRDTSPVKILFKQAQVSDTGRYTCVASNIAGEDEKDFDVNIQVPPSFQDSTSGSAGEAKDVILNNPISLYCETNAVPPPTLTWYKDGRLLASNDRVLILPGGRVLQIPRAQAEDSGRYTCVAVNDAGEDSIQYDVRVLLPPSIRGADRDVPEEVVVLVNKTTRLECHADGSPPPKISWLKDRQPLNPDRTHTLLSNGRTLQILNAQVTDTGRYVCVADNVAGSAEKYFNLNVHVPPSILGANVENATVVVNNFISLSCESNAVPPPTIMWYKNGRLLTETANLRIHNEGQILELKGTEVSDTGQYVCKATNVAGQVDKNFHLNIYEHVVETISNPVTFACDATGIPPPSLTWLKNGRVIENSESLEMHILSGGGKLQIARSQLSDSGTYTCLASNIEGKARKSYHLTIQVPPSIVGSELPGEVSVLLNDSIQLVCRAEGTPPPTIQWLKDGQVLRRTGLKNIRISPDGSTLTVTAAHTSDGGKYTCVATNKAGEEDKHCIFFSVPPEIQGNRDVAEGLTAVLDSAVNIECVASGSPPPHLNWLKNGLPLPVSAHVRLLSAGQVLRIARVQVSDEGTYTCVASNRAGVDNKHYSLQVYGKLAELTGTTDDVMLVRGSMVALVCISDGTPTPTVSWLKDGAALSLDTHITLLNHNSTLKIPSIQIKHTGRYTCVAQNQAGEARRHFNLKVLDPPRINGSGFPTEVSVVVNHVLELVCEVEGIPVPTVNWVKDGRPLLQTDGLRLLRGGEVLRISSAQVEDTGRYSCLATSSAGDDDKEFLVRVHVPPNIAGETGVQDVSVIQNRQVTLECKSDAVPPPTLSWLKDGIPLKVYTQVCVRAGKALHHAEQKYFRTWIEIHGICFSWIYARIYLHRYKFTPDGSLHIHSAQMTDTGRYLCMATNQAGTQRKRVDLQVYVPPSIADGSTNVTVTVNIQTTLSCEATGIPKPSLTWSKDGRPINTDHNQNMYRLLSSGSLVVIAPTVEDTALYECVVTNEAGQENRAIQLTVQVPPSIADEATELIVNRLSPVVISCTASGVPEPVLHWSKDGVRLAKEGEGYKTLPSGPLEIASAELSHSGHYSCSAKNAAGSAHRHVQLTVQDPPVIQAHPTTLDVILNNHVTIPCRAVGSPRPTITWQKEGGDVTLLPSGSLQISRAKIEDSGTYMCVAQNPAGTALGKTKLRVQVPPVINSSTKSYDVAVDGSVTLQCQSEGYPTPSVIWHKDGQPLTESVRQRVLSSGSLHIVFTQPGDTGRYTCTAANVAGSSSVEMIPPIIRAGEPELWVMQNTQALLSCVAEGVPQPTINWEREGVPLTDSVGQHTILPSGELIIDTTQPEDAGTYTCVATNSVGQDSWTITLSVHTHPAFTELLGDVALNMGERLLLACGATGIPTPKITWAFNNNIIPAFYDHVNGHSELVIEHVSKDDAGTYSCVAENHMGSIKSVGFVYVKEPPIIDGDVHSNHIEPLGGNAILNCEVRGDPLPTIQWSKNGGRPLLSNDRITILANGSLRISSAQKEDTAEYACIARNLMGSALVRMTLTVRVNGGFSEWMEWGSCSVSCGAGVQRRLRLCSKPRPANGGRHCVGPDSESRSCKGKPCPGGPQKARGSVIGNINDVEFGIAILNATISTSPSGGKVVRATITNVPRSLGPAMRKLISLLNPIYWTTAQELGEAFNGYSLTDGLFRRETQVEFATGEILRMTHVARGLDTDGALLLDIVVNGHILQLPSNDYTEDYIQTGPGQLYALSTRMFSVDRVSVPYSWNHTISYDPSRGKMPYLVQTLHTSAINAQYHPLDEMLDFTIHATIAKGIVNQCPSGFLLDPAGPYCADENECVEGNPCSHACHNAIGTYYCSCPRGLTISADGRTCQDIDECSLGGHICHDGQDCENTIGSYRCVMRCGRGFRRTADGLSCSDINECQETNPCHQHCLNTIGSFRCACEAGYQLRNRRCIDINECRQRVCRSDQQCKNTRGGYTCIDLCPTGMTKGANSTCIDIDECRDGTHLCRYNQICENTRGSYHCTCPRGYRSQGVGQPCLDINECEHVPMPCAYQCANSPGSYKCLCPPGRHLLGDGKSCAGLERLPSYESFSYGFRTSQSSPERRYHSLASQSYHSYTGTGGRFRLRSTPSRSRRAATNCPHGFRAQRDKCLDINECEQRDTCQHECMNTPGSHKCLCPSGYRLMTNGKTCQDIDECLEQNIQCGSNRMCFNMRGSYQCIDTPCPPNYQREPNPLHGCGSGGKSGSDYPGPYALEYKLLSLPFGIAANQDLIRLVAYTQDGVMHPRTSFLVVDEDTTLPFALRDENLKGVLFTTRPLREPHTYRMKVKALSYSTNGGIEYQTTFIVYIAVSAYPY
uniref:Hemicentin-1 n=1 Tax=Astyanax mexicanus TaxID=7994 RepID=A0A8B9H722_ASTMX